MGNRRVLGVVDKVKVVDLFPYQVKNVNNFKIEHESYHPVLEKQKRAAYWRKEFRHIVEGKWVNDEGTWVFMMPKLYFYINYGTIELQGGYTGHRPKGSPRLRDNEWIIFSYLLCCQGFSGFADDPDYTCNNFVKEIEEGGDVEYARQNLTPDCFKKGTTKLKKYVEPWEYLTETYLLDDPRGRPLGRPEYYNQASNYCLMGSRTIGKTLCLGPGDCIHEFLTNGIKRYEDLREINKSKIEIYVGASQDAFVENFLSKAKETITNLPGKFRFNEKKVKPSPLFRNYVGKFNTNNSSPVRQVSKVLDAANDDSSGSKIGMGVFTVNNPQAAVGQRPVRIYVDEVGLLSNAVEVHESNASALAADGWKHGIAVYTGTSGNLEKVKESQDIFENPIKYEVYPIPNYWGSETKMQGMFMPYIYANKRFFDENGNVKAMEATKWALQERKRKKLDQGSAFILNRPLVPNEMFMASGDNLFPQINIMRRLDKLENGLWKSKAAVGWLQSINMGGNPVVKFVKNSKLNPILDYTTPKTVAAKKGAWIQYEAPIAYANNREMYLVVYDPVADPNDGSSLASILVYKYVPTTPDGTMYDTIVAEWIGRLPRLEDIHQIAIDAANYYGCGILYEANTSGLGTAFRLKQAEHLLEPVPFEALQEAVQKPSKKITLGGVKVNKQINHTYMGVAADHAAEGYAVATDEDGEETVYTNVERQYSLRLLREMVFYNLTDNFDHLSSYRLAMMWMKQKQLKPQAPTEVVHEKNHKEYDEILGYINTNIRG